MKPIDVCLVTEYFHPVLSGATERFRRYAPGLRRRGVNIRVITVQRGVTPLRETVDGILVHRLPVDSEQPVPSAILLRKAIQLLQDSGGWPDVLQLISHTLQGVPDVWRLRLYGVPTMNIITMIPQIPSGNFARAKRFMHQWLRYSPFNLLVTSSAVVTRQMTKQGVSSGRLVTIPNGVDIRRFHPVNSISEKRTLRLKLNLPLESEIILFVGFICHRKGVDLLIESWPEIIARRPRANLLLVGPLDEEPRLHGERSFYKQLISRIHQFPHPERVQFTGEVQNVESYMRAANLLVLPSRLEGMGNVVAEAMASGLPCVITPYDGLPDEFGEPGHEYLLASFEKKSIANNVISLLEDKDLMCNIQLAARERSVEHLDVEKSLDQYAGIYKKLSKRRT